MVGTVSDCERVAPAEFILEEIRFSVWQSVSAALVRANYRLHSSYHKLVRRTTGRH